MKNGGVSKDVRAESVKKENGDAAAPAPASPLARKVRDIYETMRAEGISEIEIKEDNVGVHIRRASTDSMADEPDSAQPLPPRPSARAGRSAVEAPAAGQGKTIASPINGIFFRSSSPKSAPFVSEGDVVEPGKTLCIVEAMKVMNEIKADSRAKVVKILVENGAGVSYGQPLFAVE